MGGKGSGGPRVGAGRPKQNQQLAKLHGSRRGASRRKRNQNQRERGPIAPPPAVASSAPAPAASLPDVQIPEPPGNLTLDELAVWNELAPLAQKEGTLTDSTARALRDLCEAIVLKGKLLRTVDLEGLTVVTLQGSLAAHPLITQFRGLMQRVEAGMLRFRLSPMGKEIPKSGEPAPVDPFAEFDGAGAGAPGETTH